MQLQLTSWAVLQHQQQQGTRGWAPPGSKMLLATQPRGKQAAGNAPAKCMEQRAVYTKLLSQDWNVSHAYNN